MALSPDIHAAVRRLRSLGERLRFAREARKLGSNELSRLAGLTESYVSSVETGRRTKVAADALGAVARVLHVRLPWLMEGLEPMEETPTGRAVKANLERCLEMHPSGHWIPQAVASARLMGRDRPVGEWETILDRLQAAIAPIVGQNDR